MKEESGEFKVSSDENRGESEVGKKGEELTASRGLVADETGYVQDQHQDQDQDQDQERPGLVADEVDGDEEEMYSPPPKPASNRKRRLSVSERMKGHESNALDSHHAHDDLNP